MKLTGIKLLLAAFICCFATSAATYNEYNTVNMGMRPTDVSPYTLWYNTPATKSGVSDIWMEYALPIGNGQIGATILGGIQTEDIQLKKQICFYLIVNI